MSEITAPRLAFYLKIRGYHIKQTFSVVQALTSQIDMIVYREGVHISFSDRNRASGHIIQLPSSRLNVFKIDFGDSDMTYFNFSFDPNEFYRAIKSVTKNAELEVYYLFGENRLCVRPGGETRGVLYVPLVGFNDPQHHQCNLMGREPNIVMDAKIFSSICKDSNIFKCKTLYIHGSTCSVTFQGLDATKTKRYEKRIENYSTSSGASTSGSSGIPLELLDVMRHSSSSFSDKEIVRASLPVEVFKNLVNFGNISNDLKLYLYFSQTNIVLCSDIGGCGNYLIEILALPSDT